MAALSSNFPDWRYTSSNQYEALQREAQRQAEQLKQEGFNRAIANTSEREKEMVIKALMQNRNQYTPAYVPTLGVSEVTQEQKLLLLEDVC